jgi:hypothetical protein
MPGIANELVSVPLGNERLVTGLLFGNDTLWSFECSEDAFLKLFPAGVVYSFNDYGKGEAFVANREFQQEVWDKLTEILYKRVSLHAS